MPPSTEHPQGGSGPERPDGPSQEEVDRRFAELMSDLDLQRLEAPEPDAHDPAIDVLPEPEPPATPPPEAQPRETLGGPRDYAPPDELDEHFEPAEPEPLGTADPIRLLAWTGAIAGPVLLLVVLLLWPGAPAIVWLSLLAATLVGWGVAIARLPRSRDDGDDGAVV